ncbi:hypothetical protein F5148DRAFT_1240920 [Russula earlei]|uniref:Uncharacterized protein n=1 Tax=Russula earlei TaxID=71964 RepID=A0ACC0TWD0_9AGAM|nr:hypothetical protein F5148DRAFT_1240920 [Russula earlei]
MSFFLFFLLAHITIPVFATSSVSVLIPLDEQQPPIARINHPYSWTFAEGTFWSARNVLLQYSLSSHPEWLSFDPANKTVRGTPTSDDEGSPRIELLATDPETSDSASSSFLLRVTHDPPPILTSPVSSQFISDNPSLASVFVLSDDNSALQRSEYPTLRIPPSWSFSIGFDENTFTSPDDIYYVVLQADGSPLPSWMEWDPHKLTLDGVTPPPHELCISYFMLALHASDRFGLSAASQRFDVAVAAHELHASPEGLTTINNTLSSSLDVSLKSQAYFNSVFVDNALFDPQDLVSLGIDVSQHSWLHYNPDLCRLTGLPPKDDNTQNALVLPVVLTTTYNQTLHTQVKLASVPSSFVQGTLPPVITASGGDVHFNMAPFLTVPRRDVDLVASYEPTNASSYLHFDTDTTMLTGCIPSSDKIDYVTVLFTAYSHLTHSISHSSLSISLPPTGHEHTVPPPSGTSLLVSHRKLTLGLRIALALLGGLLVLGLILAVLRCLARPPDAALTGVAAIRAMTASDRQWYGIEDVVQAEDRIDSAEKGYGTRANERCELGIGLSRARTFTSSNEEYTLAKSGQLSKAEFLGRLRATVRKVSNRYRGARKSDIGRPVLVLETTDPRALDTAATPAIPAIAGYEPIGYSGNSLSLRGSPSSSIGSRSIPQRRADFAPPRVPAPAVAPISSGSVNSDMSLASDSSTRSHAAEAVVQRAARARSVCSASGQSRKDREGTRARFVPFTASRMTALRDGAANARTGMSPPTCSSSMSASVVRVVEAAHLESGCATDADELHMGLRYVRALGEDAREASGSFSSLESSHPARSSTESSGVRERGEVLRVLVRVGERFRFRLPVPVGAGADGLTAQRVSGELLPAFLYADLNVAHGDKHRDTVKFWGVPRGDDVGNVHVGVYGANGACVAEAVIEVLIRSG